MESLCRWPACACRTISECPETVALLSSRTLEHKTQAAPPVSKPNEYETGKTGPKEGR